MENKQHRQSLLNKRLLVFFFNEKTLLNFMPNYKIFNFFQNKELYENTMVSVERQIS